MEIADKLTVTYTLVIVEVSKGEEVTIKGKWTGHVVRKTESEFIFNKLE